MFSFRMSVLLMTAAMLASIFWLFVEQSADAQPTVNWSDQRLAVEIVEGEGRVVEFDAEPRR